MINIVIVYRVIKLYLLIMNVFIKVFIVIDNNIVFNDKCCIWCLYKLNLVISMMIVILINIYIIMMDFCLLYFN